MAEVNPALIQHTLIGASVTKDRVLSHAQECVTYGFGAAMVQGSWVDVVSEALAGTGIPVASALDFPEVGLMTSAGKAAESAELVRKGAQQIDIGVQIGWLKSGMSREYQDDIRRVVDSAGVPIKVMLELPLLNERERDLAVDLAVEAGVAYVKNASSGAVQVASPESIQYLKERVPSTVGVKASGGIKSLDHAQALLAAGADMLGTSAGIALVSGVSAPEAVSY
jgi:deoxyribose-phosphate aldolase